MGHPTGSLDDDRRPPTTGLSEALKSVRDALVARWSEKVKAEVAAAPLPAVELTDHMPAFVDELIEAAGAPSQALPSAPAAQHGSQRLRLGFNVGEVVREYGLLQACIFELVSGTGYSLQTADLVLIGHVLNQGIAEAISQYVLQRDTELERQASEHLGFMAHEVRNGLSASLLNYELLRPLAVPESRAAIERLGRNLRSVAEVVDNALTQSWLRMGVEPERREVPIRAFLEEILRDAAAVAQDRRLQLESTLPSDLVVAADPRLLRSAVTNLLTNAVKFSPRGSTITLRAAAREDRLSIEVQDACGGLPPGRAEELFSPLVQRHRDRSGFGLGLAIVQQAAEAHGGTARARDLPGVGCVFSLDLPLVR